MDVTCGESTHVNIYIYIYTKVSIIGLKIALS